MVTELQRVLFAIGVATVLTLASVGLGFLLGLGLFARRRGRS